MGQVGTQDKQLQLARRRARIEGVRTALSIRGAALTGASFGLLVALTDVVDRFWPSLQPHAQGSTMEPAVRIVLMTVLGALIFVVLAALGRAILKAWHQ